MCDVWNGSRAAKQGGWMPSLSLSLSRWLVMFVLTTIPPDQRPAIIFPILSTLIFYLQNCVCMECLSPPSVDCCMWKMKTRPSCPRFYRSSSLDFSRRWDGEIYDCRSGIAKLPSVQHVLCSPTSSEKFCNMSWNICRKLLRFYTFCCSLLWEFETGTWPERQWQWKEREREVISRDLQFIRVGRKSCCVYMARLSIQRISI